MLSDENDIRSRLRSSKARTAATAPSSPVLSAAPEPRRTRGRAGPSQNRTHQSSAGKHTLQRYRTTVRGSSVNDVREPARLPGGSAAMARVTPRPTRERRSGRQSAAIETSAPATAEQLSGPKVNEVPGNCIARNRPIRACTIRSRTASALRPVGNAHLAVLSPSEPHKTLKPTRARKAPPGLSRLNQRVHAIPSGKIDTGKQFKRGLDTQGPQQPPDLPKERAETQELYQKVKETKERLIKKFSPVSYTDHTFLSSLYVNLASDEDIAKFLLEPDSGFAIDGPEEKDIPGGSGTGGDGDESDFDSDYPESEDEEGAQHNKEYLARPAPYLRGRWTQMPEHPAPTSEISASLLRIMQRIVEKFAQQAPGGVSRTLINTSCTGESKTRPDIVIQATGPSFEVPSTREQRILQTNSEEQNPEFMDLGYTNAASVIEVRRESAKGKDKYVGQLGAFCSEIWAQQPNRMFTRALLITETTVRLVHYDRAGVYVTPVFNHHTNPHTFVRLVLGLTSTDETVLGLDTSIQWNIDPESGRKVPGTIVTMDENQRSRTYNMQAITPTFHKCDIRGRGTTCWSVMHPEGTGRLIIKDAWQSGDGPSECVFLEAAQELQGVGRMLSYGDNLAQTDDFRPTSYRCSSGYRNRTKLRIVMEAYGDCILEYKSRYQLLAALKDAIRGHHALVKTRILHRDISAGNILLGDDDAEEGSRGVLIDLDVATWMDRDGSQGTSDSIVGTRLYQSIGVLWGYAVGPGEIMLPHDYLDDLESFLYVLCQAMFSRVAPGKPANRRAEQRLLYWQASDPDMSRSWKAEFSAGIMDGSLVDTDYWGEACNNLLQEFQAFVGFVARQKTHIRYNWQIDHDAKVALLKDLGRDINKYYGGIDRLFEKALDLLKTEEPQIDARLAKLALAVPRGTPELDLGLKRKLDQLEDAAGSERVLAKRRQ